jgi:two-component system nitrogen regulation sensor histidine kinase NtrY
LHVRLVFLFSLISAVPDAAGGDLRLVGCSSPASNSGFPTNRAGCWKTPTSWRAAITSRSQRDLEYESLAMAADLGDFLSREPMSSPTFPEYYSYQVQHRKLNESAILQKARMGQVAHAPPFDPGARALVRTGLCRRAASWIAVPGLVVSSDANRDRGSYADRPRAGVYLFTARESELLAFSRGTRQNIVEAYDELTLKARVQQFQLQCRAVCSQSGLGRDCLSGSRCALPTGRLNRCMA